MTNFDDFLAESLKDPQVRKEYDALEPEYELKRQILELTADIEKYNRRLDMLIVAQNRTDASIAKLSNHEIFKTRNHMVTVTSYPFGFAGQSVHVRRVDRTGVHRSRRGRVKKSFAD
ncbi:MAG: hypothetical protein IJ766_05820 [Clostridia bacterium]|nr:hypothetical protein [Clostridia bacterium]